MRSARSSDRESTFKAELAALIRGTEPEWVVLRHEDKLSLAIPDMEVVGHKKASWWEGKFADPSWEERGDQTYMLRRLNFAGWHARYIIWEERKNGDCFTRIVHPRQVNEWATVDLSCTGFDMTWLVNQIRRVHS